MTSYFLGLLTAIVFFCCLILFFWMGIQYGKKKPPDKVEVEEETLRKQKQIHDDFIKTMSYNEEIARQRKKVT